MMNNGFYYQALATLQRENSQFVFPRFVKDILKDGDIENVKAFSEAMGQEISSCPLTDQQTVNYFTLMADVTLMFHLYREDYERFMSVMETVDNRMQTARSAPGVGGDIRNWQLYFEYLRLAARRLMRIANLEEFENYIDHLSWNGLDKTFIQRISGLTGFIYLNENDKERFAKSRFWMHKAVTESDEVRGLVYHLNLAQYFFTEGDLDSVRHIEDLINRLKSARERNPDFMIKNLLGAAVLELQAKALLFKFAAYDDKQVKLQEKLASMKDLETNVAYEGKSAPVFVKAFLKLEFGMYYRSLASTLSNRKEISHILAMATENVNEGMRHAERIQDTVLASYTQLQWLTCQRVLADKVQEKELKEIVNTFRKNDNLPMLVAATKEHARYFEDAEKTQKAFEVYFDLLKYGLKRIEDGGIYLVVQAMELTNRILLGETDAPGVSWMVTEIEPYFEKIREITDALEANLPRIGTDLLVRFRSEFARMEPASHFNAKVYLRYQWYEIKMLRLSTIASNDDIGRRIADNLLRELEYKNNPLNFITAAWPDFKDVSNDVRNKMLNLCINISKGDLPMASEHLDFSYRNLRSYITFKEVNRLGFFLDEIKTRNRQLESGIRLMFHDLYKNGTIFEVVFDMPKFLVETADSGFSSQDMEESMRIKGTTAKKYIKIMMDINLVELEKSIGRKHFYRLRRDVVMTRLGKETKVMTS